MNKILDKYLAERKQPQDKDVDDVKGSQPKKYFKGLDKDDKKSRANYFARGGGRGKAPGDDDPDNKTSPSKHTKKYKQLFGDDVDEGVLQGRDYVFDKKKKKVVISKDNYKKVQRDSKTTIKGVPYIMYNMGNQGTVLAPVHFEEVQFDESLWDNIRKKKARIARGSGEKMRKKGEKGAPTVDQMKRAQESRMGALFLDIQQGATAKELSKDYKIPLQVAKDFLKDYYKGKRQRMPESIEEDMTAISSWKNKLKKVKGLTKQQLQILSSMPTPVITQLINQIGMVVASNDMAEDGHTDVISAKNQVKIAMKALNTMNQELNKLNDEDDLPSWWTNKVAVAVNKLDGMADYLDIKVESVTDIFNESDIKGLQEKAEKALKNKAKETGMPLGILRKVFQRGVKAWQSGHRPGTNAVQWGLARVNSFVTKGKGTWGKADSDLAAKVRKSEEIEEKAPDTDDAMKRFKAGKAGFTDKAHLKAKGLIPRADGTKRKSDKYK